MKRKILFLISLMFSFILSSCSESIQENVLSYGAEKSYGSVSFSLSDTKARVVYYPENISISRIQLLGSCSGSELLEKEYKDLASLKSAKLNVPTGVWSFRINAYTGTGDSEVLYGIGTADSVNVVKNGLVTVKIDLKETNDSGVLELSVSFPDGAELSKVSIGNYEGASFSSTKDVNTFDSSVSGNVKTVTKDISIEAGYYSIIFNFSYGTQEIKRSCFVKVSPGHKTSVSLKYSELNFKYGILYDNDPFHDYSDFVKDGLYDPTSYRDSFILSEDITLPEIETNEHYDFLGWSTSYDEVKLVGTDGTGWKAGTIKNTVSLYPVFEGKTYSINWYDFNGNPLSSKNAATVLKSAKYGSMIDIPALDEMVSSKHTDANPVKCSGIFKDSACSQEVDPDVQLEVTGDLDFYVQWEVQNVYVDEVKGKLTNYGTSPTDAVSSLELAKKILAKKYLDNKTLYAVSALTKNLYELTGITDEQYGNAVVKRYETLVSDPIIKICDADSSVVLSEVTIDGGAIWNSGKGPAALTGGDTATVNDGISAQCSAITVEAGCNLILGQNTIIVDNCNVTATGNYLGGGISNSGTLVLDGIIIRRCFGYCGGGIYSRNLNDLSSSGAKLEFLSGTIGGDSLDDGNGSNTNGGGICVKSGTFVMGSESSIPKVTNNRAGSLIYKGKAAAGCAGGGISLDGYDSKSSYNSTTVSASIVSGNVSHNVAHNVVTKGTEGNIGTGGGFYFRKIEISSAKNCSLINNSAYQNGGGFTLAVDSKILEMDSFDISNNEITSLASDSNAGGAGISATGNNSILVLKDCQIKNNSMTSGLKGSGIYISTSNPSITLSGSTAFAENDIYYSTRNSNKIKISGDCNVSADIALSEYTLGKEIFDFIQESFAASKISNFNLKGSTDWALEAKGQYGVLTWNGASGSGMIVPDFSEKFYIKLSSGNEGLAGADLDVTFAAFSTDAGGASVVCSDWEIKVVQGDAVYNFEIDSSPASFKTVKFKASDGWPKDEYTLVVYAKCDGMYSGGTFKIKLN